MVYDKNVSCRTIMHGWMQHNACWVCCHKTGHTTCQNSHRWSWVIHKNFKYWTIQIIWWFISRYECLWLYQLGCLTFYIHILQSMHTFLLQSTKRQLGNSKDFLPQYSFLTLLFSLTVSILLEVVFLFLFWFMLIYAYYKNIKTVNCPVCSSKVNSEILMSSQICHHERGLYLW